MCTRSVSILYFSQQPEGVSVVIQEATLFYYLRSCFFSSNFLSSFFSFPPPSFSWLLFQSSILCFHIFPLSSYLQMSSLLPFPSLSPFASSHPLTSSLPSPVLSFQSLKFVFPNNSSPLLFFHVVPSPQTPLSFLSPLPISFPLLFPHSFDFLPISSTFHSCQVLSFLSHL